MTLFRLCTVLWMVLLAHGTPSALAQDAFVNEFHTDDRSGGYLDGDGDGQADSYTDLEFVEFALHDDAPFDVSDVLVIAYDGSGTYAGYAIGDPLWEAGEQQGDYRLYSYGPFRIPTASAPASPERGAFPDAHGALALVRWRADDTLERLDFVSYGGPVSLNDDPWLGTVDANALPVGEDPAPASDTSGLNLYALGLAGAIGPEAAQASGRSASQRRMLRVQPHPERRAADPRPLPALKPLPAAAPGASGPSEARGTEGPMARTLRRLRKTRRTPNGRRPEATRNPSDARQTAAPDGLAWMVFANTGTPGALNGNQQLPVELTAFDVALDGEAAVLAWQTASEVNNAGFYVEHAHRTQPFEAVGFVEGAGTTTETRTYRFRWPALSPGVHMFRLRQVDTDGSFAYTEPRTVRVAAPRPLHLTAPSPHPVTQASTLTLTARVAQTVDVALYDALGRRVATLYDGRADAHAVYDVSLDPSRWRLPSGMYFVRATGERHQVTRQVVVVR